MEHFCYNIRGFFDYERVYDKIVKELPNKSHIVEIGAWTGMSTAYLAVEIINSGKDIRLDVVDTWKGSNDASISQYADDLKKYNGDVFSLFIKNMQPVIHVINPIHMSSEEASKLYENESLDFVFTDANHLYEYISKDILCWLPKIKKGGFMGGHDYHHKDLPDVTKAVDEHFKNVIVIGGDGISTPSWLVKI